ncbi:MAG: hypothetical protein U0R44_00820 [Candidatus Micrarchaeia archaeon]
MYHIGIVQYLIIPNRNGVVSSDDSVQCVIRMWDGNLLILGAEKKIGRRIRKGDYVIADYTPASDGSQNRKQRITKIVPPAEGSMIWAEFQDEFNRRKSLYQQPPAAQQRYIR